MRHQFLRLKADLFCFKDANSRETAGELQRLLVLEKQLVEGTPCAAT